MPLCISRKIKDPKKTNHEAAEVGLGRKKGGWWRLGDNLLLESQLTGIEEYVV